MQKIHYDTEHPWRGFRVNGDTGEVIANTSDGLFYGSYGYETVKKVTLFDNTEKVLYIPQSVSIIADPQKLILSIYGTSNRYLAEQIFGLLQRNVEDLDYIRIVPISFTGDFLKWLVGNATLKGKKMFLRMNGVKVVRLRDFDSNLNDAILLGDDEIGHSRMYRQIQDNGPHRYVVGYMRVQKSLYGVRVYDYGQITITARDATVISPDIPVIAAELQNLQNIFNNSP